MINVTSRVQSVLHLQQHTRYSIYAVASKN